MNEHAVEIGARYANKNSRRQANVTEVRNGRVILDGDEHDNWHVDEFVTNWRLVRDREGR